MLVQMSIGSFLEELASSSPAPGGGSVAALSAALGNALTAMVCRLTLGRKKYAGVEARMGEILAQAESLQQKAARLVDEDCQVFCGVMEAFRLPKNTEEEGIARHAAIQDATRQAVQVPLEVMRLAEASLLLVQEVAEGGNRNSISDSGVAVWMIRAALEGAALNVRINLSGLDSQDYCASVRSEMEAIQSRSVLAATRALALVEERIG